ncbi:MAG: MATE family efflux transporter, partial [Clostridia bacterium]|nr:MATE family efflux transporter [Clostridia bacterium]
HGSGNYISRKLGEGDEKEGAKMASAGFFYALMFGVVIMTVGLLFTDGLALFLGATETIKPYAADYLRYILIGTPFMVSSFVLNNQMRFQGNAVYSMVGMCSGAVINIGLDALFILKFGMGTAGAGLATAISQTVSFLILSIGTFFGGNLRIKLKNFPLSKKYVKEIFKGGLPSLGRQGLSGAATVMLNFACALVAGKSADELIAAMGIVAKIMGFFASVVIGLGQGFQPVCGFNYGAKKYDRVKKSYFFTLSLAVCFSAAAGLFGGVFSGKLLGLFTNSDLVVQLARPAFISQCAVLPAVAVIIVTNMMLQNIGKAVSATVLSVARQGLCFIPVIGAALLIGVVGVQFAQAASDICAFTMAVFIIKRLRFGEKNDKIE